jgi:hypothetical protein
MLKLWLLAAFLCVFIPGLLAHNEYDDVVSEDLMPAQSAVLIQQNSDISSQDEDDLMSHSAILPELQNFLPKKPSVAFEEELSETVKREQELSRGKGTAPEEELMQSPWVDSDSPMKTGIMPAIEVPDIEFSQAPDIKPVPSTTALVKAKPRPVNYHPAWDYPHIQAEQNKIAKKLHPKVKKFHHIHGATVVPTRMDNLLEEPSREQPDVPNHFERLQDAKETFEDPGRFHKESEQRRQSQLKSEKVTRTMHHEPHRYLRIPHHPAQDAERKRHKESKVSVEFSPGGADADFDSPNYGSPDYSKLKVAHEDADLSMLMRSHDPDKDAALDFSIAHKGELALLEDPEAPGEGPCNPTTGSCGSSLEDDADELLQASATASTGGGWINNYKTESKPCRYLPGHSEDA